DERAHPDVVAHLPVRGMDDVEVQWGAIHAVGEADVVDAEPLVLHRPADLLRRVVVLLAVLLAQVRADLTEVIADRFLLLVGHRRRAGRGVVGRHGGPRGWVVAILPCYSRRSRGLFWRSPKRRKPTRRGGW